MLEINNINYLIMKSLKYLIIVTFLTLTVVLGFVVYSQGETQLKVLDIIIIVLILGAAAFAIYKGYKSYQEEKQGIPIEDEFSNLIKYKSGHQAYLASMYMWLFIFLFKDFFPDVETMLGGGILLSALIGFIAKFRIKQQFNEEPN